VTDVRDPEVIRHEIDETREQLGEAVEELAAKTNVKARAREKLAQLGQWARGHPAAIAAVAVALVGVMTLRRS
jgi:2C-methyl-D-erythritol 2,4-cyclodiphosphate synthase